MTIDTHQGFKELIAAGVPEEQAEAHLHLLGQWIEQRLVTREYLDLRLAEMEARMSEFEARMDARLVEFRADLRQEMGDLRAEMRQEMGDLRSEMRQEMGEMERRLNNRLITVVGVATAFLSVLIAIF